MMIIFFIMLIFVMYWFIYDDIKYDGSENKLKDKCWQCGSKIEKDFNYCPKCKVELRKKCDKCGNMIDVCWRNCPYC